MAANADNVTTMDLFQKNYNWFVNEAADPRTKDWPMVHSPLKVASVVFIYVTFCLNHKTITAKWPTYNLKPLLIVYNLTMVALSLYMMYEFFMTAYLANYSLLCQPVDFSDNPLALRMASVCWVYYFSKYIEMGETVMFALRKKYNQITFLHCYHHTTMAVIWWSVCKFVTGGQSYIFGGINSFVHAVMYTYYGLSAIGPHMQKYLWWKKHITKLQLSQFVILFFYCIRSQVIDCDYPRWLTRLMIAYAVTLFTLFMKFYLKAYMTKPSSSAAGAKKNK